MAIRGIHHTGINVRDFDKMLKFYTEGLGFEIADDEFSWKEEPILDKLVDVKNSAARGIMLKAGSCYLELFHYSNPEPTSTRPNDPNDRGYTHLCLDVTNIEEEYTRLKGLGMTFGHFEPMDMGHVKSVYGRDPEGNVIEIQETADYCKFPLPGMGVKAEA